MRKLLPLLVLPFLATPASAQQQAQCFPYEATLAALADGYQEVPVARMLDSRGFVIEILASVDGSSFTVIAVSPDMTACPLASGTAFSFVSAVEPAKPGVAS